MAQESGFCSHCKRSDIPIANLDIHIVHCKRNAVSCPICHITMPRVLLEEHHETTHAQRQCPQCEATMENAVFDSHLADSCPMRQLECCYCQLHFAHRNLAEHLSYCGSRTERCELCSRFVMLKDMLRHDETACGFPPAAIGGGASGGGGAMQTGRLPASVAASRAAGALQTEAEEDIMGTDCIPCEFCKRKFHLQEIMHHQSSCVQSPLVSPAILGIPEHTYSNDHGDTIFSSLLGDLRLSATGIEAGTDVSPLVSPLFVDGLAADMVPCEFCSACLPMDLLPHHQDVCARLSSSVGREIRGRIGTRVTPSRGVAPAAHRRSPEQEIALRMLRSRAAHLSEADQSHGGSGEPTASTAYRAKGMASKAGAHRTVEPKIKKPEASAAFGTALLHAKAPSLPASMADVTGIADSKRPSPTSISLAGTQAAKPEARQGQAFRAKHGNFTPTTTDETASVSHQSSVTAAAARSLPATRRAHGGVPMLTAKQHARGDPGVTLTPAQQLQPTAAAVTVRHAPTARGAAAPRPPSTRNASGAGGSEGIRNSQFLVSGARPVAREGQADANNIHIQAAAARPHAPARRNAAAFDRVGAAPRSAARPS